MLLEGQKMNLLRTSKRRKQNVSFNIHWADKIIENQQCRSHFVFSFAVLVSFRWLNLVLENLKSKPIYFWKSYQKKLQKETCLQRKSNIWLMTSDSCFCKSSSLPPFIFASHTALYFGQEKKSYGIWTSNLSKENLTRPTFGSIPLIIAREPSFLPFDQ